jgi:hypothetical protein
MVKRKAKLEKAKQSALVFISGLAFVALLWFLFYGKVKASQILAPILGRVPKNEAGVVKMTDEILGTAVKKVKGENVQRAVEQGSEFFEESQYAEPARQIRDEMKEKIDEVVTSAKELPAKELKTVQREVCKQWLGDEIIIATPSAQP